MWKYFLLLTASSVVLYWTSLRSVSNSSQDSLSLDESLLSRAQAPLYHDEHHHDVLVIGAGLAGLAAARMLHNKGISVAVLEAKPHIGGRTLSHQLPVSNSTSVTVEIGAQWMMGTAGNPLAEIAEEHHLEYVEMDDKNVIRLYDELTSTLLSAEESRQILQQGEAWWHYSIVWNRITNLQRAFWGALGLSTTRTISPKTLSESATQFLQSHSSSSSANNRHQNHNHLTRWVIEELYGTLDYAGPPHQTAGEWIGEGIFFTGGMRPFYKGFAQLPRVIAYDQEGGPLDIRTQQVVESIHYHDIGGNHDNNNHNVAVAVTTTTGATFSARHAVIVTVPLGVLQHDTITFSPPLPPSKQQAISRLKMGTLEKVYLIFDHKFWPSDLQGIGFVNTEATFGELPLTLDMSHLTKQPTLLVFAGGDGSTQTLETMTDDQIVQRALDKLSIALRGIVDDMPRPVATLVTRWQQDPFAMGSYSYLPVGTSPRDMDELARPLHNTLFFAGEATIGDAYQSTHGAYLSGRREAANVLRKMQGKPLATPDTASLSGILAGYFDIVQAHTQSLQRMLYRDWHTLTMSIVCLLAAAVSMFGWYSKKRKLLFGNHYKYNYKQRGSV